MKKKAIAVAAVAAGLWASSSFYFLSQSMPRKEKPALGRRRIACIGDSITFGAGVLFGRERLAWPFLLDRLLGGQFQVMNFGISGATVQQEGDSPYISKSTGVGTNSVGSILASIAPSLLALLGKGQKGNGIDASGLAGMLGMILGGTTQSKGSNNSMGGLGSILGSILGQ